MFFLTKVGLRPKRRRINRPLLLFSPRVFFYFQLYLRLRPPATMPVVSRPAPGAPKVEQLTRMYPKHLPTSAVMGNSQTRYLHQHFDPYDRAAPAFITIRGASTFDIEKELANLPRSVTTLVFHVGTSELERYGTDETLRRCRRLVNNTLRARPELRRLVVSLVLPRHTNRRLDQSNHRFVHWFNTEARKFNNTVKDYCRKPGKVTFLDHDFTSLPPLRVLAADGLHPSFTGVAILAANLKALLQRGPSTTSPGWSSEIPAAATANCSRTTPPVEPRHPERPRSRDASPEMSTHPEGPAAPVRSPGAPRPATSESFDYVDEYPTPAESVAPKRCPKQPPQQKCTPRQRYQLRKPAAQSPSHPKED